jgi:hypothetical protein
MVIYIKILLIKKLIFLITNKVGALCEDCDLKGNIWNKKFVRKGFF